MKIDAKAFGSQLKKARERACLTQEDVIERLAKKGFTITQGALSHYEKGRRFPDPPLMAALAQVVETSLDYLLTLTETDAPVAEIEEDLAAASGGAKINKIMERLPKETQQQIITFAEFLLSQQITRGASTETTGTNEAAWNAAMNVLERKYGKEAADDFLDALAAAFPDLATLVDSPTLKKKRVQKG